MGFLGEEAAAKAHYHLILAADVFMYLDDLAPVLKAAAAATAPSGLIAFSVETHDGDGVILRDTLALRPWRGACARRARRSGPESCQPRFRRDSHRKGYAGARA